MASAGDRLRVTQFVRGTRPIIIGDLARHDQTLELWLEAYLGESPVA